MFEILKINEKQIKHAIFKIIGDGSCLFRALSYLMYGYQRDMMKVRSAIVYHVIANWDKFQIMSNDSLGNNYSSKHKYLIDMSKKTTFGTASELFAAGEIYEYFFEVYQNGELIYSFGNIHNPVKRLRFTGNLDGGHFDVLLEKNDGSKSVCINDVQLREENNETQLTNSTHNSSNYSLNDSIGPCQFYKDMLPTKKDVLCHLIFLFNESIRDDKIFHMFNEAVAYDIEALWKITQIPIISQSSIRIKVSSN